VTLGISLLGALMLVIGTYFLQKSWTDFSPVKQTMSSLAALGAPTHRRMTILIVIVGLCLIVAALSLKLPAKPGRWLLGVAGTGALGTAAFPVPGISANSTMHTFMATIVLVSMCLWPIGAHHYNQSGHWPVSLRTAIAVTVTMALTGIIFLINWLQGSPIMGLLERMLLTFQLSCFIVLAHRSHRAQSPKTLQPATSDLDGSRVEVSATSA
jgi:hypothetical membrane protein